MLSGVIAVSMQRVADLQLRDSLVGRQAELPGYPGVRVADRIAFRDLEVARGDMVACGGELGVVSAGFLEHDGSIGVIVERCTVVRHLSAHSMIATPTGRMQAWAADSLALCIAWKPLDGSELLVIGR